jgi:uncharacterized protein (DUF2164 family)
MAIQIPAEDLDAALFSIQKYLAEEFDQDVSAMKAKLLLDFFLQEIGPLAYNQGVGDAERYFREKIEDLAGTCFEDGLGYWKNRP